MTVVLFFSRGHMSENVQCKKVRLYTTSRYDLIKEGNPHASETYLSLFSLRFSLWYIRMTCFNIISWLLPSVSYPRTKISSAVPSTFGGSLEISYFMLEDVTHLVVPNVSLMYLYLPNQHAKLLSMIFV